MSTTKTRTELVNEAAECLLIVGSGQSLDEDDADKIDGQVDPLLAQLAADRIVFIADDDEIPNEYFKALAELLANSSATKFGKEYSPQKKEIFEAQLRKTSAGAPSYETLTAEYF